MDDPLLALVARLEEALAPGAGEEAGVRRLLAAYAARNRDWRRYAAFRTDRHTRRLVFRGERFELLVMGWEPRQASPVHDHGGRRCWMTVLRGCILETPFAPPGRGPGPLRAGPTAVRRPGEVSYVHDDAGLHRVAAAPEGRAVSLHLYAGPLRSCRVFDPRTGRAERVELTYDNVPGPPVTGPR